MSWNPARAAGFEVMIYVFVLNSLTQCATLLGNNYGKRSQYWGVPYHLKVSIYTVTV